MPCEIASREWIEAAESRSLGQWRRCLECIPLLSAGLAIESPGGDEHGVTVPA